MALLFGDRDRGPELDLGEVLLPLGVFELVREFMEGHHDLSFTD